ncbi:hypothetical protein Barb4_02778 [Bacteroidales bacterium Barb4]|nr:hypothetical protein Barb4_02778 [Bacteroidales bacterium Barb4]
MAILLLLETILLGLKAIFLKPVSVFLISLCLLHLRGKIHKKGGTVIAPPIVISFFINRTVSLYPLHLLYQ